MSRCTECGHMLPMTRTVVCSVGCFVTRRARLSREKRDAELLKVMSTPERDFPLLPQLTRPRLPAGSFYGGWRECKK